MLCARLKPTIISQQSVDQAAYREGYSTEDHLITITLLLESCGEWNVSLCLGLVDFEKAFDTVEHGPLWQALEELGVAAEYIDFIKVLYREQESTVLAGKESRAFPSERGVKQGDPISSLLFLAVMECIFRKLKKRWHQLNLRRASHLYGIVIDSEHEPLTNLRFADDVILVASSRADIRKMILDLKKEAARFGMKINASKTKVMATDPAARESPLKCGELAVQVLQAGESEKYLGRKLSVDDYHACELNHRLATGWAAFFKFKGALCNKGIPLSDRAALFEAVVTPCVLYACGTWVLTADMVRKLRSTQRKMFRRIVRILRRPGEPWPDYVSRATHTSEDSIFAVGAKDWVTLQDSRKLELATKCMLHNSARWSNRLLQWKPWFRCLPRRNVGHPVKRWLDSFESMQ